MPEIIFGAGTVTGAGERVRRWGRKILVVTGRDEARSGRFIGRLADADVIATRFVVEGEPTVAAVLAGLSVARTLGVDAVVGFGGGSAIDAGKAIAGLLPNPGDPVDYLETIGAGRPLVNPAAPWIAVPTTAGTGAEATRNAVLSVPSRKLKVSLRSPHLFARVAIIDPELTLDLPPAITVATGLDALTQLIEAYVCTRANPFTDVLCTEGIVRAARALPRVWKDPRDLDARSDLSLAALWSGQALANAGLGAVHGFASPLGGMFSAPHGAVCAALLAPVMERNIHALEQRLPASPVLQRYAEIARWLTGRSGAGPTDGVDWVRSTVSEFRIQSLSVFGIAKTDIPEAVAAAGRASSMKANPVELTEDELAMALSEAI